MAGNDRAPRLEFDWEEGAFRAIRALFRRVRPKAKAQDLGHKATLAENFASLAVLAGMIADYPLKIEESHGVGGLRGDVLLIPACFDLADSSKRNRDLYVLRTCIQAAVFRQLRRHPLPKGLSSTQALIRNLQAVEVAHDALCADLPEFESRFRVACGLELAKRRPLELFRGRSRMLEEVRRSALNGNFPKDPDALEGSLLDLPERGPRSEGVLLWGEIFTTPMDSQEVEDAQGQELCPRSSGREIQAQSVEDVRLSGLDLEEEFNPILHTFEKVETLDNHAGGVRHTDGTDDLDDQLDALEEVDFNEVIRGGEPAEAVMRADLMLGGDIPDIEKILPGEKGIEYDEWDTSRRRYREKWCTVYPTPILGSQPAWASSLLRTHGRLIDDLERKIRQHRSRLQAQSRQRDGESIDIDAMVHYLSDLKAGEESTDRLYIRNARKPRDFATTVLVDISLSTDSWIDNRRVLDIAREAVLVLGEVSDRLRDKIRVLAFASHTRNVCRVWELHGWEEPWSRARDRLGVLRPQGYTRIGPALRHATADLKTVTADARLLLLVSDGKPSDYDRYEGRYGMSDVRQALREAAQLGICVHALAIDSAMRHSLSATFGVGCWDVLSDPALLPKIMTEVYGRLAV